MVVIMKAGTKKEDVNSVVEYIKGMGLDVILNQGIDYTVLGLIGETGKIDPDKLMLNEHVDRVMRIAEPFKKASRKFHPENTVVKVGDAEIGRDKGFTVIAGPCSVESEAQMTEVAANVKKSGAKLLRGGAYKPRTSPYSFQGLALEGLEILKEAREQTGLPIVTEIMSPALVERFERDVDVFRLAQEICRTSICLKNSASAASRYC